MQYKKKPLSIDEQISKLENRGLIFSNKKQAAQYLQNISYYRLRAFTYPYQDNREDANHEFIRDDIDFMDIIDLYVFDKRLRSLVFNEIEKIEIAIRSSIVSNACEFFNDPYWITDSKYFMSPNKFQKTLSLIDKELEHSKEDFIIHFRSKYSDTYPPAWILAEILSLGTLMNVYYNLRDITVQKKIAKEFGLQVKPFESWMTIVTLTRNSCCHHARVWNKQNTMLPMEPKHITRPWIS
ncbi:MAG: Abi family protein, partial [Paludibacteraceae bacterium]|nr:Abi family protein [Paludibacteraceae bacterium]